MFNLIKGFLLVAGLRSSDYTLLAIIEGNQLPLHQLQKCISNIYQTRPL